MGSFSFEQNQIYELESKAFVGGQHEPLRFSFIGDDNLPIDISGTNATWTLSNINGTIKYTQLRKEGIMSGIYAFVVYLEEVDTKSLSGKYLQQITINDQTGRPIRIAQGILKINLNNDDQI